VPARRPQGKGRRRVELGRARARDAARGLLGDQVDHQHPGRPGAGRRRPRHRRPRPALRPGVARHEVPPGHDPRPPQQRQRPVLGHRHRLRRPAAGRGPHAARDRPRPALPPGQGVDLQQRGHPDPRPGGLDRDRRGDPRVRGRAAVRSSRHDPHPDDGRPRGQHQCVLRHPDHVRGPGPVRLPVPPPRSVGRRPGRAAVVGEGGRRSAVAGPQRGVRPPLVAQPQGSDHRPAGDRRARSAEAARGPDHARPAGQRVHGAGSGRPDGPGRPGVRDGRGTDRPVPGLPAGRVHRQRRRPVHHRSTGPTRGRVSRDSGDTP
jgi:hypothetical protein